MLLTPIAILIFLGLLIMNVGWMCFCYGLAAKHINANLTAQQELGAMRLENAQIRQKLYHP